MSEITILVGSDHFGFELKGLLIEHLLSKGYNPIDCGTFSSEPVDYPDIAYTVAEKVRKGEASRAILVCATGAGMAIVANKVPGVRAVCIHDPYTAERARASNNAQVATLGAKVIGVEVAKKLVDIWLSSEFQGGRSLPKVEKIEKIERLFAKNID